jgi:DNA-binding MarR family transcriptional regulator
MEIDDAASEIRRANARLTRRLRTEAGHGAYSDAQISAFRVVFERGEITTSELARFENVRPQSMSATIAALEAAGVVGRRPDPRDGRAILLFVTDEGRRAVESMQAAKDDWLARRMTERLTVAEQGVLRDAAAVIDRLLQP